MLEPVSLTILENPNHPTSFNTKPTDNKEGSFVFKFQSSDRNIEITASPLPSKDKVLSLFISDSIKISNGWQSTSRIASIVMSKGPTRVSYYSFVPSGYNRQVEWRLNYRESTSS